MFRGTVWKLVLSRAALSNRCPASPRRATEFEKEKRKKEKKRQTAKTNSPAGVFVFQKPSRALIPVSERMGRNFFLGQASFY